MTAAPVTASIAAAARICDVCGVDVTASAGTACPGCGRDVAPPSPALRGLVMRGSAWTIAGYGAGQVVRFASNVILVQFLAPQVFGLMMLVSSFMQGLQMFSDIGIGPSIVQHKRGDDPKFLDTAWTVQVIRGALLWIAAIALAYPLSVFYSTHAASATAGGAAAGAAAGAASGGAGVNAAMLRYVLPVVGINALIAGLNPTALFTANRKLALGKLTLLNLGVQLVTVGVMIAWAKVSPSVWAVVAGGIAASLVYLVSSRIVLGGRRDRFRLDRECLRDLTRFGRWIFLSTLLTFLVGQGDRLIFGKMIPLDVLGVYSNGLMLATFSAQALMSLGGPVLLPAYSQRVRSGRPLGPVFNQVRHPISVLAGYTVAGVAAAGPTLIGLVYPASYGAAAWMVPPLAAAGLLQAMECTNGAALLALGQARWVAAGNAAKLIGMAGLIPLGYHYWQFPGAVGGLVASELLRYAISVVGVKMHALPGFSRDVLIALWVAATAAAGWFLGPWLEARGFGGWARLFMQSGAVTVLWLPVLWGLLGHVRGRR